VTAVGVETWDGQGNTVATYTASVNGNIFPGITVTGTYSVNPDCTGSNAESDGSHYNFVVSSDGNSTTWIQTDPGTVISGTETRLRNRGEGDARQSAARKRERDNVSVIEINLHRHIMWPLWLGRSVS
jgi:hypothetical protein